MLDIGGLQIKQSNKLSIIYTQMIPAMMLAVRINIIGI
jgi:hypothetical protein